MLQQIFISLNRIKGLQSLNAYDAIQKDICAIRPHKLAGDIVSKHESPTAIQYILLVIYQLHSGFIRFKVIYVHISSV